MNYSYITKNFIFFWAVICNCICCRFKNWTKEFSIIFLTFKDGASSIASEGAIQDNISEGKYLDVLRKQEDGSWKCLVHTWEQIN